MPKRPRPFSPATPRTPAGPLTYRYQRRALGSASTPFHNPIATPSTGIGPPGRAAIRRRDWEGEPSGTRRRLAFEVETPLVAGEAGAAAQLERIVLGPEVAAALTLASMINILLHARTRAWNPFPDTWEFRPLRDWWEDWLKKHQKTKDPTALKHFGEYPPVAKCMNKAPNLFNPIVSF